VKNLVGQAEGQGTAWNGEEGVQMLWQELRRPKWEGTEVVQVGARALAL